MLDLVYLMLSFLLTSLQICWYMAGRTLVRFLKAALDAKVHDQIVPLKTEISFLR